MCARTPASTPSSASSPPRWERASRTGTQQTGRRRMMTCLAGSPSSEVKSSKAGPLAASSTRCTLSLHSLLHDPCRSMLRTLRSAWPPHLLAGAAQSSLAQSLTDHGLWHVATDVNLCQCHQHLLVEKIFLLTAILETWSRPHRSGDSQRAGAQVQQRRSL
ncbi:hypothetical protein BS78_05G110100 [Paspalum vaginatum]|nr:hypothetical protein BS78_05G110100 [Paspalum vaginatum]